MPICWKISPGETRSRKLFSLLIRTSAGNHCMKSCSAVFKSNMPKRSFPPYAPHRGKFDLETCEMPTFWYHLCEHIFLKVSCKEKLLPGQMSRGIMMFGMFYPAATPFLLRLPAFRKINRDLLFAPSKNVAIYTFCLQANFPGNKYSYDRCMTKYPVNKWYPTFKHHPALAPLYE